MPNTQTENGELAALQAIIGALQSLDQDVQRRIFLAAATFLSIEPTVAPTAATRVPQAPASAPERGPSANQYPAFSADTEMSPKEFLYDKQPKTDVERVAALAYYLTHYRDTPHFKTLDLSKLNTEAAQPKFSNAANSTNNAVKRGYLVPSTKGMRQISAAGERFVAALPDREAARETMASAAPRRKRKSTAAKKPTS